MAARGGMTRMNVSTARERAINTRESWFCCGKIIKFNCLCLPFISFCVVQFVLWLIRWLVWRRCEEIARRKPNAVARNQLCVWAPVTSYGPPFTRFRFQFSINLIFFSSNKTSFWSFSAFVFKVKPRDRWAAVLSRKTDNSSDVCFGKWISKNVSISWRIRVPGPLNRQFPAAAQFDTRFYLKLSDSFELFVGRSKGQCNDVCRFKSKTKRQCRFWLRATRTTCFRMGWLFR